MLFLDLCIRIIKNLKMFLTQNILNFATCALVIGWELWEIEQKYYFDWICGLRVALYEVGSGVSLIWLKIEWFLLSGCAL